MYVVGFVLDRSDSDESWDSWPVLVLPISSYLQAQSCFLLAPTLVPCCLYPGDIPSMKQLLSFDVS